MKTTTAKQKEKELNELYADIYSESEAIDAFEYLTSRDRVKNTTMEGIRKAYHNHELGSLLRKLDPIAFNLS